MAEYSNLSENPFEGCNTFIERERRKFQLNILRAAFNSVLAVTPPNKPDNKKLSQAAVKKLRGRILKDMIGSEDVKKPALRTAVPNREGVPFLFRGDGGNVPFVVPRVKSKKARSLLRMTDPDLVLHRVSRVKVYQNVAHRYGIPGAFYWVSARDWVKLAKRLSLSGGELLSGWSEAAESIGSNALSKVLPRSGNYSWHGEAFNPEDVRGSYIMRWEAYNYAVPDYRMQKYMSNQLTWRLDDEARFYAREFKKYYLQALRKHARRMKKGL